MDYIFTSNPSKKTQSIAKIDEHVRKLPANDPLNKYRKRFGNMNQCLKQPGFASVMHIDGNNVKINNDDAVNEAHATGILSDSTFDKYQEVQ